MKNILVSIKRFINIIILIIKNPFTGTKTLIDEAFKDFLASDIGKKAIEEAKTKLLSDGDKTVIVDEILVFLETKVTEISKGDPKLIKNIFDYLEGKILFIIKGFSIC